MHNCKKKTKRISREELIEVTKIIESDYLIVTLKSLKEAGFIDGFLSLNKAKKGVYYKIIDEYIFYLT
ncbi:MAG: hypothetical protein ACR5KW_01755 [Wolbachia sp.]